ncbi:MAG: hypothetical protein M1135_00205 [Candidatus Omnitrophica bacterium]|jgi:protein-S-isoprenylcysteine O-methyltransferase Ste14|nr:hypothetical protein [Candidatus Omnitrophota bacterium]
MKKTQLFFLVSLGVIWEWIIIPIFFFLYLPKGKNLSFIFPHNEIVNFILGIIFLIPGFFFTITSFIALHQRGTMLPNFPPENLIINGVYKYCRNPMYLGYSFLFVGSAFLLKDISYLFISIGIILFIFLYAKLYEEKELILRFGESYLNYKKSVPFIFPFKLLNTKKRTILYHFSVFSLALFLVQSLFILKALFLIVARSDISTMIQIVLH